MSAAPKTGFPASIFSPAELGNLTNLGYLQLRYNLLTGLIPPELANLTNLVVGGLLSLAICGNDLHTDDDDQNEFLNNLAPGWENCQINLEPIIESLAFTPCLSQLSATPIDASASDPVGGVLSYSWEALDGGVISIALLAAAAKHKHTDHLSDDGMINTHWPT